jgi:NAD+ synthase (glutamine-hydrolysing)
MFKDLDHPFSRGEDVFDVTFENVQAGLRTDYLFRLANHENGIVIGTGDLSELALGWCTYGVGDHMSHYNVNTSVPKTLIQHLIRWSATSGHYSKTVAQILKRILDTEISPELVPPDAEGKIQSTEDLIGPYALHDFFLFYTLRHGFSPRKIAFLAQSAWSDTKSQTFSGQSRLRDSQFDLNEIVHWLEIFVRRFFQTSQFKRSVAVNGPKVSRGGALSPRGDWRAPSDSSPAPWLDDVLRLKAELRKT